MSIMDITGRVYVTQSVANASGIQTVKLDTCGITAGIYMINVANATGSFTQNLVIE